jgi:hypothetical protein
MTEQEAREQAAALERKINERRREMATPKLIIGEGGRTVIVQLIKYEHENDTFTGMAMLPGTIKVDVIGGSLGEATPGFGMDEGEIVYCPLVRGLTKYPNHNRPDRAFQYVELGDDVEPLRVIGRQAGQATGEVAEEVTEGNETERVTGTQSSPPQEAETPQQRKDRIRANKPKNQR